MRYSFSDCVLDTDRHELLRAGRTVALRPKVFQVLTYLIEQRHRVVTKEDLFEKCWPGVIVGDASLNSCLKEIRKAIGDSGTTQKYLRTLHGHGYHFVATAVEDVAADAKFPQAPVDPAPQDGREFKLVSVLACRVINAGELALAIGPEALDASMRSFFRAADGILERYGGTLTERLGDGFTALFGAPQAFEDHARRAAMAAVEILDTQSHGEESPLGLGIGLHTGQVIVGAFDDSAQLFTAAGETTEAAKRIRDASDHSILASEELVGLIETDFECRSLPSLDGLPQVAEIVRLAHWQGGVPHRKSAGHSRFVGRGDEMAIIEKRLQLAMDGAGQAICISGEPGIGKSRLLQELATNLRAAPVTYLQANCLAYCQASPYFALLQLLRHACGASQASANDKAAARLTKLAHDSGLGGKDIERLAHLLDPEATAGDDLPQSDVAQLFAQASRLILCIAEKRPVVLAIEDLHWLDATTGQWLMSFVPRIAAAAVLLLVTFRPGYQAAWLAHSNVSQLALPRLNDADSTLLISSLRTPASEANDVQRRIVSNAQGNPFFLEELTLNLVAGDGGNQAVVPTTVQAVLAARIDQLSPTDKTMLQLAAVIGSPVRHALLAAISPDTDIDASIASLASAELLYEAATGTDRSYYFKHALTQDVAYQSLLTGRRREYHRVIGEAYEEHFVERMAAQPELVAHHFTEAGIPAQAARYWRLAGENAVRRSANPEAVTHFEKALRACEALPQTDAVKREQLDICIKLGPPTMSSKAFASPAVEETYRKASKLCAEVGDSHSQLLVLWGLWLHHAHRGKINDARPLADKIMQLAKDVGDEALLLQAHHAVWTNEIWHGDLETCFASAMAGKQLYDPERHQSHKYLFGGHDPGVCARGTAAIAAWFLGRPQQAIELTTSGAQLADELDHPYSRIITMHDFMETEALRGNPEISAHYGKLAIDACMEQSVPNYLAVGHIFAGYGEALTGDPDSGMRQMKLGLETYESLGAARNVPPYLMFFAEVCASPENCGKGLEAIEKAMGIIESTGTIRWLPELKRAKGELLLIQSADALPAAESLFREALNMAADQGCRSFELRAATSLARILIERGDKTGAHDVLMPIYDNFSEGFDTRDLRVAAALADSLR